MKPFGPIFWGVFLILAGVIFLIKHLFNLQFSAWSVVAGLFVVLIGGSLLWSSLHPGIAGVTNGTGVNNGAGVFTQSGTKYDTAFSNMTINLADAKPEDGVVDIDVAFSNVEVSLPADTPVEIQCDVAFAGVTMPDGQTLSFGERTYTRGEGQMLRIKVDGAFCRIVFK